MSRLYPECREWQGHRVNGFYGQRRDKQLIHRWVWQQINGPIPPGMDVMHTCDNPPCFLYAHLTLGTRQDNMDDMVAKGRQATSLGERHASAKLTWVEVDEIRDAHVQGESLTSLAERYGVTTQSIRAIVTFRSWKSR
jgi:hypothetical protein